MLWLKNQQFCTRARVSSKSWAQLLFALFTKFMLFGKYSRAERLCTTESKSQHAENLLQYSSIELWNSCPNGFFIKKSCSRLLESFSCQPVQQERRNMTSMSIISQQHTTAFSNSFGIFLRFYISTPQWPRNWSIMQDPIMCWLW